MYGLPKIHKPDFKNKFQFRPILAAFNTPSFKLAKFLVPTLSPLTTNEFTCKNSYQFSKDISTINGSDSLHMASFDIENLYTNIPLVETIDIILDKLFTSPCSVVLGLPRSIFKALLELSVMHSFFLFNGKFYKQTDGLGMGQPLSPTFANIFLCFHEEKWLSSCPPHFKPVFYRRYIDDTFLVFKHSSHVPLFLNYLNNKHPNIKFTSETEISNGLPFLDCNIHRVSNAFETSVYRKNTFSGLGISNFSFCSNAFKLNSINTLLFRAYGICSNYFHLHNEFNFLINFFKNNGFCSFSVHKQINRFLNTKYLPTVDSSSNNAFKYIVLPYFGPQSDKLKLEVSEILKKYFTGVDFKIISLNKSTIGQFFNFKDKLPRAMLSSIIYSFSCERCSSNYVGMTSRNFYKRIAEHAGRSFRTNSLLSHPPHSAIRDHTFGCNSPISINQFKIIDSTSNQFDLKIIESLHILSIKPSLNNANSSYPLQIAP